MRSRVLVIAALALLGAGVAVDSIADPLHLGRHERTTLPPAPVSLVGDSLNVGVEPYLRDELPGWSIQTDDVVGRPTAIGLERLDAATSRLGRYVVISLGTNDPETSVDAFRSAVGDVIALAGPGRCVVWATIHRDGDGYEPFNSVLRDEASQHGNLRLVDWTAMIRAHPEWLAADGIHATPDGYRARADAIVQAMRSCPAAA